jgi:IS30 family transposase
VQSNNRGEMQKLSAQLQNKKKEKKQFLIQERRRKVTSLLAQARTETEIATVLQVHVSTISRDVSYLRKQSQQFVYDLAKSDLAFYYKQCLDGIEEVRKKSWEIYNQDRQNDSLKNAKDKLLCLKLIKECNEAKFALLKDGPSIINLTSLEERISKIESR